MDGAISRQAIILKFPADVCDLTPGTYSATVHALTVNGSADENSANDYFTMSTVQVQNVIDVDFDYYNAFQLRYYFRNNSKSFESCKWEFGDGTTSTETYSFHDFVNQADSTIYPYLLQLLWRFNKNYQDH
ncbi:MAG: hypothetical protein IPI42_08660 [Saprospiraceae bacterium]|nr:hypothetical protein [Candidatus Parvibacillus calidus]